MIARVGDGVLQEPRPVLAPRNNRQLTLQLTRMKPRQHCEGKRRRQKALTKTPFAKEPLCYTDCVYAVDRDLASCARDGGSSRASVSCRLVHIIKPTTV